MNINIIKDKILNEFKKNILVIVYYDNKYYFGLENDNELDYTMNIRYFDSKLNSFNIFNGMDDIQLFKKLQELAREENLLSSL